MKPEKEIDFKSIFRGWERLRPVYIGLVAIATLVFAFLIDDNFYEQPRIWLMFIEGAIIANLAYFGGPVLESYLAWLGRCPHWYRVVAFLPGCC